MISYNQTHFILAGFTLSCVQKPYVFASLIIIYSLSLMANFLTIITITIDKHLQAPMYFFLRSLASLDILFISSTVPKLLSTMVTSDKSISLNGCLVQLYIYLSAGGTVFYTLGLLSIDRYLAICHPLRYNTIMNSPVCWRAVACTWIFGFLEFLPAILFMSGLRWCSGHNVIDHFFCDGSTLLYLSCSDTHIVEITLFYFACFTILSSLIATISSYCFIITTILRISSSTGRRKAFSTCSSHFIVVLLAYGSCILIYVFPEGVTTYGGGKTVAILNSILTPFLHPFIYSLRNQAVITSIKHMIKMDNCIK